MLPKFASHVLHQTQRAAATAQNYAIRNVLGLQNQSSTPGSLTSWSNAASGSSSGWGSAGGAKSSTGNWFYQGYTVSFSRRKKFDMKNAKFRIGRWTCRHSSQLICARYDDGSY